MPLLCVWVKGESAFTSFNFPYSWPPIPTNSSTPIYVSQKHPSCQILCSRSQILFLPPGPYHQNHSPMRGENPSVNLQGEHEQNVNFSSWGRKVRWELRRTELALHLRSTNHPSRSISYERWGAKLTWWIQCRELVILSPNQHQLTKLRAILSTSIQLADLWCFAYVTQLASKLFKNIFCADLRVVLVEIGHIQSAVW